MTEQPKGNLPSDYKCSKCESVYVVPCVFVGDKITTLHCIDCNEVFEIA